MLEYGFDYEGAPQDLRDAAHVWLDALTKQEQEVFDKILPFMAMITGVPVICTSTAEIFARRLEVCSPGWIDELAKCLDLDAADLVGSFANLLKTKFIGYRTNVRFETNSEWVKRMRRNLPKVDPAAKDDKARFDFRAAHLPKWYAGDARAAMGEFREEREARIAATKTEVQVEVSIG